MIKPILIVQLRPEEGPADDEFTAILKYGGIAAKDAHRLRIETAGIPDQLDPFSYSAIIVGGSPFDISTPAAAKKPIQVKLEKDFMRLFDTVVTYDIPFLGICSGNGLLGNYLNTPITKKYGENISCVEVEITQAGKLDPLLADFPESISVFVGHKEACDELPQGATLLAKGEACPIQLFRIGKNVYASQFHPELDPEGLALRARAYMHHGYLQPDDVEKVISQVQGAETPYAQEFLKRFVNRYVIREN